jgi:hypothetical protein
LFANPFVSEHQRELAESILRAVGIALWLDDEEQMDAVTALSGSGPAYFFLMMEALETAGSELGLPPRTARLLTLQTALGAAKMALESEEDVAELRQRVTSPGGTTEQALKVLEQGGIRDLFQAASRPPARRENWRDCWEDLMGNPYPSNGVFLVNTVFGLYILAVMLRLLLGWVRADFYTRESFHRHHHQSRAGSLRRMIFSLAG